ncbi:MAG TPA: HAMP domain-containing sensor histidine kinase [Streptosporangiaceae bacterium]|nr:HAMP domain-containing sensor histidine kinase [Streptosporangiaceae bacterium]
MNRRGISHRSRLSLRGRLLAALIAVTAAFLIVLGVVAAIVFDKRIGNLFDGQVQVAAQQHISQMVSATDIYAVYYSLKTHAPGIVNAPSPPVGKELESYLLGLLVHRKAHTVLRIKKRTPFTITLSGGPVLRGVLEDIGFRAEQNQSVVPRGPAIILAARPLSERERPLGGIVAIEVLTGLILLALLAASGPWLIRRGLAPLNRMATTADDITTRGDLTARMPDPGDRAEMGRLSSAINTMLDRIQQAFNARLASEQKVRQFAADASHELRTPLTTIRGYAELYRQGALGPDRLPDAMRRIEQEADRMSRLVAELLELARLDRTSSLNLTETDLAQLVHDAVADASAVEPGRPIYAEAPPSLVAVVDEPRVRQILSNLLGNVRAHTPPGTPTAVRLGQVGETAVLEVADSGPGMSADDAAKAFDRFHRSSSAGPENGDQPNGSGDKTGSGLGLSIVQAIARAHGGQATLESVPGHGTRVRVWLPLRDHQTPQPSATTRPRSA